MAYVGLAKPTIATLDEKTEEYSNAFNCGEAIQIDVTPQYAEGSLYGDNRQVEYDKEFKYADVTLNATRLPVEAHNRMFGHTVDTSQKKITYKGLDDAPYVGFGFYVSEKVNGVRGYVASWLHKVKFSEGAESYKTKGDSIEYQTPSLTGRASEDSNGEWKTVEIFATEAEAEAWIKTQSGQTVSES